MPACQGPQTTVPDADVDSAASFLDYLYIVSQYTLHSEANDSLRLAHSLPPQLKLCTLLSATTEFTNCSMPKPKVHRMWYYDEHSASAESSRTVGPTTAFAETECPPKAPICPHSAPKPKPKFGRPLE